MPQNLEHAQKLVPSPDLTRPFLYFPEAAQWMPHNYVKFQHDPPSGAVDI